MNPQNWKKVDSTTAFIGNEPRLVQEEIILAKVRRLAKTWRLRNVGKQPTISRYPVYIGGGFPIKPLGMVKTIPRWKDLSDWMKSQVGVLAMAGDEGWKHQHRYVAFNHHLHNHLIDRAKDNVGSLGELVRNGLSRECRRQIGYVLPFMFVVEEWASDGQTPTQPHVHGFIELPSITPTPFKNGNLPKRFARLVAAGRPDDASRENGMITVRRIVNRATANGFNRNPIGWSPEYRNTCFRRPYGKPSQFVSYAFKNVDKPGHLLGGQRLFKSRTFIQGARELWVHISGKSG